MKLLRTLTLITLFFCSPVFAAGSFTTNIIDLGVTLSGNYAYINISPIENVSTCTAHSQVRFELDSDSKKSALSIALAAKIAGKKVKFYFSDNDCLGDSPKPTTISIID